MALWEAGLPGPRPPSHILATLPPRPDDKRSARRGPRPPDPDKPSPEQIRANYVAWLDREHQIDKAMIEASRRPTTGRPRLVLTPEEKVRRRQERNTAVQAARRKAARASELLGVPLPRSPLPPMPEADWVPPPPPPPRPENPRPKYLPPLAERRRLKAEHKVANIRPTRRPAGRKTRADLLHRQDRLCKPDPPDPDDLVGLPPAPAGIPPLHIPEPDYRFDAGAAALALLDATTIAPSCRIPVAASRIGNVIVENTPVAELFSNLERYTLDPLGFVKWAFPWGEPGTPLEGMEGPEEWQREQMARVGKRLREYGPEGGVIEEDVSSGHGIGKSAMVSWMILWAISTYEDTRGVITANTDAQLRTKTWAELAKWYEMFIGKHLFKLTATAIYLAGDPVREKKWRIDQAPWSKENTEAFAGMHNLGKRILVIFDEAAAIDDHIYEVTEGALTDARTQIIWLRYGNPTRTSGRFFKNCSTAGFISRPGGTTERNRERGRNTYTRVDSRSITFSNKTQIQAWVDDYGEDSDFVRVRVKGEFPRAGYSNFISPDLVVNARKRRLDPVSYQSHAKILAVDPARFGDDSSVITLRQGHKVHWQMVLNGFDGPDLASRIFEICRKEAPISCVAYDAIGNGADLDSALRRMPGLPPLIAVQWGQPAKDAKQYFNQRSECWGTMRDWLAHGQIPDDNDFLAEELTSLDYGYSATFQIQLQSKKDIKKNGGKSPDRADSVALSFVPELIDRKIVLAKVRPVVRRKVVWSR